MFLLFVGFFIVVCSLINFLLEDLIFLRNISKFFISESILFIDQNELILKLFKTYTSVIQFCSCRRIEHNGENGI
jgi:hypothetical protein